MIKNYKKYSSLLAESVGMFVTIQKKKTSRNRKYLVYATEFSAVCFCRARSGGHLFRGQQRNAHNYKIRGFLRINGVNRLQEVDIQQTNQAEADGYNNSEEPHVRRTLDEGEEHVHRKEVATSNLVEDPFGIDLHPH